MDQMRQGRRVTVLCCLTYFASYLMRLGFAAGLVEISAGMDNGSATAALACTGLSIAYGAGQFLSGWMGDRFKPVRIISFGLCGTAICNLLLPWMPDPRAMIAIWCANGLCQAMLWPPMVRIMAETLDSKGYLRASSGVSIAASFGTMAAYALMSAFVRFAVWQWYFRFVAAFGAVMAIVFLAGMRGVRPIAHTATIPRVREQAAVHVHVGRLIAESGLPMIMLAIVMQGMLRDGVTTWMPTLVSDTTDLGSSASILSVVILPVFSIFCIQLATVIQRKMPNDAFSSAALFLGGALCAGLILPMLGNNTVAVIALLAILTGCMHAVNFMLICHIPSLFASYGCVSVISGVLNSCTYLGSAISTYGIALFSNAYGWFPTVGVWAGIALAGALLCLTAAGRIGRFTGLQTKRFR